MMEKRNIWNGIAIKETAFLFTLLFAVACSSVDNKEVSTEKPNIILIVSDDQGISDAGFSGSRDIRTPHIDKIAHEGVIFSQGYVSHSYCSPSRAGILSGRYQQRFGHELNPPFEPENEIIGLPLNEKLISNRLKEAGYRTGAIGKWHLGYTNKHLPPQRGFDFWYGFAGGARSFWTTGKPMENEAPRTLMRNNTPVPLDEVDYLTDNFTDEALNFIRESKDKPFFLYLAYNAPHTPLHASKKYLDRTSYIERAERSIYAAMITAVDDGVGKIDNLLSELNIKDNTIIVFISDNGGVTAEFADNTPYRGYKGMLFEGGIRVPFCMSWKNKISANTVFNEPVIALDLFPTFMAAAGVNEINNLDGKDLLPYVSGQMKDVPHEALYWRTAGGASYAVRKGKYKLSKRMYYDKLMLFDLENDAGEMYDIAEQNPELVKELKNLYDHWDAEMVEPLWTTDGHVPKTKERLDRYNNVRKAARKGERNN
ncbi:MAG: sulfatase-like hydrolase/transferase [Bacteroidetes bacterium]|nr:sulfatase-like hydrolase/transferase [Bacteroidota bacterium]